MDNDDFYYYLSSFQWVRVWELLRWAVLAQSLSQGSSLWQWKLHRVKAQRGLEDPPSRWFTHTVVKYDGSHGCHRLVGDWCLDVFPCWASWWCDSYLLLEWVIWDEGGNCNVFYGLNLKVILQSALKRCGRGVRPKGMDATRGQESLGSILEAGSRKMIQLLVEHPVQTICLLGVQWPGETRHLLSWSWHSNGGYGAWAKSLQSCLTLCYPMDRSWPGSSIYGILRARILEWVAVPSSRGSSPPRDWTHCLLRLLHQQAAFLFVLPLVPPGKPIWNITKYILKRTLDCSRAVREVNSDECSQGRLLLILQSGNICI